jgi:hypothetical protein
MPANELVKAGLLPPIEARSAHVDDNQQRIFETEQSGNTFVTVYKANDSIEAVSGFF